MAVRTAAMPIIDQRSAVPYGAPSRIAILNRFEYEKTHEHSNEPKCSIDGFAVWLFLLALGPCGRTVIASDFVVLVLSETVLVLVLDGC